MEVLGYENKIYEELLQAVKKIEPNIFIGEEKPLYSEFYAFGKKRGVCFANNHTNKTVKVSLYTFPKESFYSLDTMPNRITETIPFDCIEDKEKISPYIQKLLKGIKGDRLAKLLQNTDPFEHVEIQLSIYYGLDNDNMSIIYETERDKEIALGELGVFFQEEYPSFIPMGHFIKNPIQINTKTYLFRRMMGEDFVFCTKNQ